MEASKISSNPHYLKWYESWRDRLNEGDMRTPDKISTLKGLAEILERRIREQVFPKAEMRAVINDMITAIDNWQKETPGVIKLPGVSNLKTKYQNLLLEL